MLRLLQRQTQTNTNLFHEMGFEERVSTEGYLKVYRKQTRTSEDLDNDHSPVVEIRMPKQHCRKCRSCRFLFSALPPSQPKERLREVTTHSTERMADYYIQEEEYNQLVYMLTYKRKFTY